MENDQDSFYDLRAYDYSLPSDLIAQHACEPRDHSRLMVVNTKTGNISEILFKDLPDFLSTTNGLVFNDTKVIPARLIGYKKSGASIEMFLVKPLQDNTWNVLAKPGKKLKPNTVITFGPELSAEILETLPDGSKKVEFHHDIEFIDALNKYGQTPLPPYIKRNNPNENDKQRYQTIYAANPGAIAAPTAGLHFTNELFAKLTQKGITQTMITLHVGLGTFLPVKNDDIRDHNMHTENYYISPAAADNLNNKDIQHICVGTTCCRTLEAAYNTKIPSGYGSTDIFIYPGYEFKFTKSMITNFHLPKSTLLMLLCALGGYELIMEAYKKAVKDKFRFYSYGDSMLILG